MLRRIPIRDLRSVVRLCFSLFITWGIGALGSNLPGNFFRYGLEEGLSQITVRQVVVGPEGFVWLGTSDGLNRFDGYEFKVFRWQSSNPHSLSGNQITSLTFDGNGQLWVGTQGSGLNRFDPITERVERVGLPPDPDLEESSFCPIGALQGLESGLLVGTHCGLFLYQVQEKKWQRISPASLGNLKINAISTYDDRVFWVATDRGLYQFDPSDRSLKLASTFSSHIGNTPVLALHVDQSSKLWIATEQQILSFDPKVGKVTTPQIESLSYPFEPSAVNAMTSSKDSQLWIASDLGLWSYDVARNQATLFQADGMDSTTLSHSRTLSLDFDQNGNLWIGTFLGLNSMLKQQFRFSSLVSASGSHNGLSNNLVFSIDEAPDFKIWIGTEVGLDIYDPATFSIEPAKLMDAASGQQKQISVLAILTEKNDKAWIGTGNHGLGYYDHENGQVQLWSKSATPSIVYSLLEMPSSKRLLLGCSDGLALFDKVNKRFLDVDQAPNFSQLQSPVRCFYKDALDRVFVGSETGLWVMEHDFSDLRRIPLGQEVAGESIYRSVFTIQADAKGRLWVGTQKGVVVLDGRTFEIQEKLTLEDGLPSNLVFGIYEDYDRAMWISTLHGLVRYHPRDHRLATFFRVDGLPGNEFNFGAHTKSKNGTLYFGGTQGITYFFPDNTLVPVVANTPLVITDVQVDNQSYARSRMMPTSESIPTLRLDSKERQFSVDFAQLHFSPNPKRKYRYKLEPYDQEWVVADRQRRASYMNLPAGDYVLQVNVADPFGQWDDQNIELLRVNIPSRGLSWLAYALSFAVLLLAVVLALYIRLKMARKSNAQHSSEAEVAALKKGIIASVSHELRTPLNGILGIVESLLDGIGGDLSAVQRDNLQLVLNSGKRLSDLVEELLDFSHMEKGVFELEFSTVDIRDIVDEVIQLTHGLKEQRIKNLDIINQMPPGISTIISDEGRVRQVLLNLMGNAVKFTEKGSVTINCVDCGPHLELCIQDTGPGMSRDQLKRIFEPFYQGDGSTAKHYSGTGLGLSISKSIVENLGGKIWAESSPGKGSSFYIHLPKNSTE